jgi:hypothetical protein
MALTNAEKQKRWRDRRNALVKQARGEWVQLINRTDLPVRLQPHLEALFEQGTKSKATISPPQVAHHILELEKLLAAAGIVPQSRRTKKTAAKSVGLEWEYIECGIYRAQHGKRFYFTHGPTRGINGPLPKPFGAGWSESKHISCYSLGTAKTRSGARKLCETHASGSDLHPE